MPRRKAWLRLAKGTKRQTDFQLFRSFIIKKLREALGTGTDTCQGQETAANDVKNQNPNQTRKSHTRYDTLHFSSQLCFINRQKSLLAILNRRTQG